MAFADLNPLGALWQSHGLRCLLLPGDVPPERSFSAALAQAPRRHPQPGRPAPSSAPARAFRPAHPPHPPHPVEAGRQARAETAPAPAQTAAKTARNDGRWQPLPPQAWPAPWQKRLAATRPGLVVWTYWNLGRDLCNAGGGDSQRLERSAFLKRLLGDLAHPAGTHTFWPACLPVQAGEKGEEAGAGDFAPHAEAFWSGVHRLGARGVVVMGSAAAKALALPGGLRPLQQTRHHGHLVWVLWDVEYLLHEEQRYTAMLAFLRQALRPVVRI